MAYALAIMTLMVGCFGWMWLRAKASRAAMATAHEELERAHRHMVEKYAGVEDAYALEQRVRAKTAAAQAEQISLYGAIKEAASQLHELQARIKALDDEENLLSFGFYTPHYDFDQPGRFQAEIKRVRERQKEAIKLQRAAVCHKEWKVDGDRKKGEKMIKNQTKIILRAFNGECDAAIAGVKYNNVERMEDRVRKSCEAINKIVASNGYEITASYLHLKLQELWLHHEYKEKKREIAETQKRIKDQMREEAQALKEFEKAKEEAQREEDRFGTALAKARAQMEHANQEVQAEYQAAIEQLEAQLLDAQQKNQRAISQAQLTRSGHVYVISNQGAFGQDIYKIGMTRRLEPLDRIKELGDASVPFSFDIHAMIYSEDAPALEQALHQAFDRHRVNRVNPRKEFFQVGLEAIEREAGKILGGEMDFVYLAEAEEYRKSEALRVREPQPAPRGALVMGQASLSQH